MATIQNMISLSDGVSPAFVKMAAASDNTANRIEQVGTAATRMDQAVTASAARAAPAVSVLGTAAMSAANSVGIVGASSGNFSAVAAAASSAASNINAVSIAAGQSTQALHKVGTTADVVSGEIRKVNIATSLATNKTGELGVTATATVGKVGMIGTAAAPMSSQFNAATAAASGTAASVGGIGVAATAAKAGIMSLGVTMLAVFGAISAVIGVIMTAFHAIAGGISLSDEYSQTTARLNLMNDGLQSTAELQDKIFASAQRSRAGYQETADFVSKIGMMAKGAFKSNDEVIAMAEQINKIFKISGTSQQEQASATLQLTQALASGVLRGEELNAVFEAAPMMIQNIADYLGEPMGKIRDMAAEGQITAEIVKNAMFAAADKTNAKYETIPKTWADIWTDFSNVAQSGLQPLFIQLSTLASSPGVQAFCNSIATGIAYAGLAVAGLINNIRWIAGEMEGVGAIIGTVFEYIGSFALAALLTYATGWAVVNLQIGVNLGLLAAKAVWDAIVLGYLILTNMTLLTYNAMLGIASARTWAIIAVKSVWAAVTGGLTVALKMLNLTMLMNPAGFVVALVFLVIAAFGAWAIKAHGLRNTLADVFEAIVDMCQGGVNAMIGMVNGLIEVINKATEGMNKLFGTSISTVSVVEEVNFQDAKKAGTDWLRKGKLSDFLPKPPEMPDPNKTGANIPTPPPIEDLAESGKDTADNTKGMKDAMEITDEDIKYMRDIAEQEIINKYTTAEIKIDMGGVNNNVSSDMDLDGMMRYINDSLFDGMVSGAEAVHA